MNEQTIKDAVQKTVEDILKTQKTEPVEKSMPESSAANGGKDEIQSGSPMSEEQKAAEEKKKKEAEEKGEPKESEEKEEKESAVEKAEKADDKDDSKGKEKEGSEADEEEDEKEKKSKMKKSIDELSAHLDSEELELIKAWREESQKEEVVAKSEAAPKAEPTEDLQKSIAKALEASIEPLRKALSDKDSLIKGLSDKIEKMASQPAYDRRSISSLETLEKSTEGTQEISKSQVLDKMLELQLAGKGVNSRHVAEFESTRNISDPHIKELVFKELKLK